MSVLMKGINGIVIPPARKGRLSKHPWSDLLKKGRILIRGRKVHNISSTVYAAAKRFKKKFAVRSHPDGVEVYLVSDDEA